ncbi:MAG TPA: group II truncated hemoglobin [Rhodocyclaceae bacterium]|nr:group II truncated hemoglobin [Rhodocyclaceae bacterium]
MSPYEILGGAPALRRLVGRFYELMDTLPESYALRRLHPRDLSTSEEKLFMYLSGWLGGPQLFVEKYGHPRLRARHLPFAIDTAMRDQWLLCMRTALTECVADAGLRAQLERALADLADHMRNRAEPPPDLEQERRA